MAWYRQRFGTEPDYSGVLAQLAPSEGDRRNLLASFFVPTEQEREDGQKVPTRAHHAIAALVAGGFVSVIATTNFDRLLEAALADAAIDPTVVSSPDHASGALPMTHSPCTIIKVHGDYLSTELKNTEEELANFDESIDRLLGDLFDQYGLIVCGWSGSSDTALAEGDPAGPEPPVRYSLDAPRERCARSRRDHHAPQRHSRADPRRRHRNGGTGGDGPRVVGGCGPKPGRHSRGCQEPAYRVAAIQRVKEASYILGSPHIASLELW